MQNIALEILKCMIYNNYTTKQEHTFDFEMVCKTLDGLSRSYKWKPGTSTYKWIWISTSVRHPSNRMRRNSDTAKTDLRGDFPFPFAGHK